jgi:predicted Fe-S protein YdhL (DUF1289 family)
MNDPRATVASPCTRNCCLDAQDVCLGCGRTLEDILRWHAAGDDERRRIVALAAERRAARAAGNGFAAPGTSGP